MIYAVNLMRDVTSARRREEWQRFLGDAGEILNASLDYETTARELARLVVPRLADWCSVDLVDEHGIQQVALAHADPDRVRWAKEIRERYPPDPRARRRGRRTWYGPERGALRGDPRRDARGGGAGRAHLELIRKAGLASAMIVPLAARGRTFGALTFVAAESGRRCGPDDLAQAEDVARRAALAIDNARLHHDAQQARRDAELAASVSGRLHAVTASLARAATANEVARVAVDEGSSALDAERCRLFLHEPQEGTSSPSRTPAIRPTWRPRTPRSRLRSTTP